MKNKHMSIDDRFNIEKYLKEGLSFKAIGKMIGKDCTAVSKEVRNHIEERKSASYGHTFNNCVKRKDCDKYNSACDNCYTSRKKRCSFCALKCVTVCKDCQEEVCLLLNKPPYVCNGCPTLQKCSLTKHIYVAGKAQKDYQQNLKESINSSYLYQS